MSVHYDYCVIGGGIVGVATARALLLRYPGAGVVLVEKEAALGLHQTGRNSGVIHSGIYYAPGSLKARLCAEGERRTKAFCSEQNIPYEERGKLIVATSPLEEQRLDALAERAKINGIVTESLSEAEISEREPHIAGTKALFVPAAAIVDYGLVLRKLADDFVSRGGTLLLDSTVDRLTERGNAVEIGLDGRTLTAGRLIACAGLQSDRLARLAGLRPAHKIVPFRGEYYQVAPEKQGLVRAMIYPVPDPGLPFLGIHLTPMIDGRLTVGPNAVLGFAREGYRKGSVSPRDVLSYAIFPGFWRTIAKNWRSGAQEMLDSVFKSRYLRACQKYCPSLRLEDLQPMQAGIRAQAVGRDGSLAQDFIFLETQRMLHVCNAPSPAATSAMPIADMIVDRLSQAGARSDRAGEQSYGLSAF
ncbi:L-2-hydroxyglutarate oxidase [Ensifer sp. IC3342]|nr:L-2-hydroxyglutarate oxidase [Ensifer sp. BRP08]MCA1447912.1 L-2-hydroxyglutarate oxidase [Ensifer sp. IC3342]